MLNENIKRMREAHQTLCEFRFKIAPLEKGYANRTLRIDLDKNEITEHAVTQQMKDLWIGGKGFDLWLMFLEINKDTKWNSPNNPICFATGPLAGVTSFPGAGKTIVTAISPLTQSIIDSNVGGYFGPYLKFAGYDAMTIVGKAAEDAIIVIDSVSQKITIEKAPLESIDSHVLAEELTEMYAESEIDKRNVSVVSAGRAAQFTRFGVLNFSFYDWRRKVPRLKQAGRGGIGTVFRDKKLKAVVAKARQVTPAWRIEENKVAALTTPKTVSECKCQSDIQTLHDIIDKWHADPEYVNEMLQDVQDRYRHIPKTAIDEINSKTGVSKAHLYHIATFYSAFTLQPLGETHIQVCLGTACHVGGATNVLTAFERELGIAAGETTKDKKFSLEAVACLGACSIAPVVKVGEEIIGEVEARSVAKILKNARRGEHNA